MRKIQAQKSGYRVCSFLDPPIKPEGDRKDCSPGDGGAVRETQSSRTSEARAGPSLSINNTLGQPIQ